MNENAERINGWAAMLGVIAAIGSYATTGQIIPGIWQELNGNRTNNLILFGSSNLHVIDGRRGR